MIYDSFACVYDRLMRDADYDRRTEYLSEIFSKFSKRPRLLLDLCCGTGNFSVRFVAKGTQVIGVDISPDMLDAAQKRRENRDDILYLCQDASELDLYGTVDGAICCLDSINHITDPRRLARAFKRVSLFLEPDCLFVFDANTLYKHETILADNTFVKEEGGVYCVWQNRYLKEKRLTEISLDFFVKEGDSYSRTGQFIEERVYTEPELREMIEKAGLELIAIYDDMTFDPPNETSQRAIYVTRKV